MNIIYNEFLFRNFDPSTLQNHSSLERKYFQEICNNNEFSTLNIAHILKNTEECIIKNNSYSLYVNELNSFITNNSNSHKDKDKDKNKDSDSDSHDITIICLFRDNESILDRFLKQFIDVEKQYTDYNFDYIFYENDSIDNTYKIISDFIKKRKGYIITEKINTTKFADTKDLERVKNMSYYRNKTIQNKNNLTSTWSIIIDTDIYFDTTFIEKFIYTFKTNSDKNIALLLSNGVDINIECKDKRYHKCNLYHYYDTWAFIDKNNNPYLDYGEDNGKQARCNTFIYNKNDIEDWSNDTIVEVNSGFGGIMFMKTSLLKEKDIFWSYFDFNYKNEGGCEHWLFCKRIRKYGKIYICPDIMCYHDRLNTIVHNYDTFTHKIDIIDDVVYDINYDNNVNNVNNVNINLVEKINNSDSNSVSSDNYSDSSDSGDSEIIDDTSDNDNYDNIEIINYTQHNNTHNDDSDDSDENRHNDENGENDDNDDTINNEFIKKILKKSNKNHKDIIYIISNNNTVYDGLSTFITLFDTDIRFKKINENQIEYNKIYLLCGEPYKYKDIIENSNTYKCIFITLSSNIIPSSWIHILNKVDKIFVPHIHIKNIFKNSIHKPVEVIHQGYNRYKKIMKIRSINDGEFRIGIIGIPSKRKNIDILIKACDLIKSLYKINIKLFIHIPLFYFNTTKIDLLNTLYTIDNKDIILLSYGIYTYEQMSEWYSNLHCYICVSSGTGWSYTPRESLYLSIPTIITNIPIHTELCNSGYYIIIDIINNDKQDAYFEFLNDVCGKWHEVKIHDIVKSILYVYNNYNICVDISMKGSLWIESQWVNKDISEFIIHKICNI
jgi:hypothetical protein